MLAVNFLIIYFSLLRESDHKENKYKGTYTDSRSSRKNIKWGSCVCGRTVQDWSLRDTPTNKGKVNLLSSLFSVTWPCKLLWAWPGRKKEEEKDFSFTRTPTSDSMHQHYVFVCAGASEVGREAESSFTEFLNFLFLGPDPTYKR